MDSGSSEDSGFEESTEDRVRSCSPLLAKPYSALAALRFDPPTLPAIPLSGFEHSLVPDMAFGWRPSTMRGGPIPLLFNLCDLPVSPNPLTKKEFPTIFHGFRPRDTMVLHRSLSRGGYPLPHYPSSQVYEFIHRRDHRLKDTRPFVGMSPTTQSDFEFDSTFEGGNLDRAVLVGTEEFELYMRADANTRGHHQWYYFSVTAKRACSARMHIVNFTKNESLYSQGMLPVVFLEQQSGLGWHRAGLDVKYGPSKLNRLFISRRTFFTLSFTYCFPMGGKVFFAYAVPYTYSLLWKTLDQLAVAHPNEVRRDVLCKTLSGLDVPLVTITDFRTGTSKPHVVLMGRIHPGETHGSWMLHVIPTQGLLHFLLSDSPTAVSLREKLVCVCVPMMNPDGVVMGNYRTGFSGNDLNRQFQEPEPQLHPTVAAMKELITRLAQDRQVLAFLDFHAHSKKKHVFLYGPHYPLHSVHYYGVRVLPKLICERSPHFRYAACRFKVDASKQRAARLVIWKEAKVANSFTIEASFYGYLDQDRSTVSFSQSSMEETGRHIAEALLQYLLVREEQMRRRDARRTLRRLKQERTMDGPPTPTLEEVIETIKGEEALQPLQEETESDSDSDSSEDDLPDEDQKQIHVQILAALQDPPKPKPRPIKKLSDVPSVSPEPTVETEPDLKLEAVSDGTFLRKSLRLRPNALSRKPVSERVLEAKLFNPIIPLKPPLELPRATSVLHQIKVGKYHGLLGMRKGGLDARPLVMRYTQKGLPEGDIRTLRSLSPVGHIHFVAQQSLWSRPQRQRLALRNAGGAERETEAEKDWRPISSMRRNHRRDLSNSSHNC